MSGVVEDGRDITESPVSLDSIHREDKLVGMVLDKVDQKNGIESLISFETKRIDIKEEEIAELPEETAIIVREVLESVNILNNNVLKINDVVDLVNSFNSDVDSCVGVVDGFKDQISITHGKIASLENQINGLNFSVKGAFSRQLNSLGSIKEFKINNLKNMQVRIGSVVGTKLSEVLMYHGAHEAIELLKGELQRAEFEISALIKSEQEERIALNDIVHEVFENDKIDI